MNEKLRLKVVPRASRSEIVGWQGDRLRVRVAAAPESGRANDALIRFLADVLGIPRSSLRVTSGHAGALKTIEIDGLTAEALRGKLPPRS